MDKDYTSIINSMADGAVPSGEELERLITHADAPVVQYAARKAEQCTRERFGDGIFIRGLVEIGSYCRNDCLYCGIRKSNRSALRYRLDDESIFHQCDVGHGLGFRTFVLQGGEDPGFGDERLVSIVQTLRRRFPDAAITLSLGERSRELYEALFQAGANRYLLRHETADPEHYRLLHPESLTLEERLRCLNVLKDIGYQVGCGFMTGSPFQTPGHLVRDLLFMKRFDPEMVGIGPFIPHESTPFAAHPAGSVERTLLMISLVRLLLPDALIPATTALATVVEDGRERGILAGANVVMPNLSPVEAREKYSLYNGKLVSRAEAAENIQELEKRLAGIGRRIEFGRGDYVRR